MDFSQILNHPDCEEIVGKLLSGTDPKNISDWLKLKYKKDEENHLHLTIKSLKDFQGSPYLDYYNQVEKDLQANKAGGKIDKKIADSLLNMKSYRDRLNEIADEKIDAAKIFKSVYLLIMTRVEQIFDKIQEDPGFVKRDSENALLKYLEQLVTFVEKHDKVINNKPDQVIQHNYVVTYLDDYTNILQETIMETLKEVDPQASFKFMEKLNPKLALLKSPTEMGFGSETPTEKNLLKEAKNILQAEII